MRRVYASNKTLTHWIEMPFSIATAIKKQTSRHGGKFLLFLLACSMLWWKYRASQKANLTSPSSEKVLKPPVISKSTLIEQWKIAMLLVNKRLKSINTKTKWTWPDQEDAAILNSEQRELLKISRHDPDAKEQGLFWSFAVLHPGAKKAKLVRISNIYLVRDGYTVIKPVFTKEEDVCNEERFFREIIRKPDGSTDKGNIRWELKFNDGKPVDAGQNSVQLVKIVPKGTSTSYAVKNLMKRDPLAACYRRRTDTNNTKIQARNGIKRPYYGDELRIFKWKSYFFQARHPGKDLFKHAEDKTPFQESQLLQTACMITKEISKLHESNMLHRDINPGNFIVDKKGEVITVAFIDEETWREAERKENSTALSYRDSHNVGAEDYLAPELDPKLATESQKERYIYTYTDKTDAFALGQLFRVLADWNTPKIVARLKKLGLELTETNPQKRPPLDEVITHLEESIKQSKFTCRPQRPKKTVRFTLPTATTPQPLNHGLKPPKPAIASQSLFSSIQYV